MEQLLDPEPEANKVKLDPDSNVDPVVTAVNCLKRRVRVKVENQETDHEPVAGLNIIADNFDNGDGSDSELSDYDTDVSDAFADDGLQTHELSHGSVEERDGIDWFICGHFKIRQIADPIVLMLPLKQIFDMLQYGSMVLDPTYQRDLVWDEQRSAGLITSMMMGYFVPPIIFNHKEIIEESGQIAHRRICVDGRQRLSSIQRFMLGLVGVADISQKKWYFCHPIIDGKQIQSNHLIMPKAVRDFFMTRKICGYEYKDLPKDIEENMFQLVQRGVTLTPAEKMRSKSGEWAQYAKQYEEDYSIVVNLAKQSRASGFRTVLTIFAQIQEVFGFGSHKKNAPNPTLQASPQSLEKLLDDNKPLPEALKQKLKVLFDRYETLVKLSSDQLTATKYRVREESVFDPAPDWIDVNTTQTFSPLELVGCAILVAFHMDQRTDIELLDAIKRLRLYLRSKHKDLRLNAQCWGTTWKFINTAFNGSRDVIITSGDAALLNTQCASGAQDACVREWNSSPPSPRRRRYGQQKKISRRTTGGAATKSSEYAIMSKPPFAGSIAADVQNDPPQPGSEFNMEGTSHNEHSTAIIDVTSLSIVSTPIDVAQGSPSDVPKSIPSLKRSASPDLAQSVAPYRKRSIDPRQGLTNKEYWKASTINKQEDVSPRPNDCSKYTFSGDETDAARLEALRNLVLQVEQANAPPPRAPQRPGPKPKDIIEIPKTKFPSGLVPGRPTKSCQPCSKRKRQKCDLSTKHPCTNCSSLGDQDQCIATKNDILYRILDPMGIESSVDDPAVPEYCQSSNNGLDPEGSMRVEEEMGASRHVEYQSNSTLHKAKLRNRSLLKYPDSSPQSDHIDVTSTGTESLHCGAIHTHEATSSLQPKEHDVRTGGATSPAVVHDGVTDTEVEFANYSVNDDVSRKILGTPQHPSRPSNTKSSRRKSGKQLASSKNRSHSRNSIEMSTLTGRMENGTIRDDKATGSVPRPSIKDTHHGSSIFSHEPLLDPVLSQALKSSATDVDIARAMVPAIRDVGETHSLLTPSSRPPIIDSPVPNLQETKSKPKVVSRFKPKAPHRPNRTMNHGSETKFARSTPKNTHASSHRPVHTSGSHNSRANSIPHSKLALASQKRSHDRVS